MGLRWIFMIIVTCVSFSCINVVFLWSQVNQLSSNSQASLTCECDKSVADNKVPLTYAASSTAPVSTTPPMKEVGHTLAVVVPFRDRYEEMMEFVPHIHSYLLRQGIAHHIWIINQVDMHRFNRAALLNIGFLLSRKECDYLVMHDIDLLPLNDKLPYHYPAYGPMHISSPALHPLYHYRTFIGGVLSMTQTQYEKVNGLTNLFWGWGREDDELYTRIADVKMKVQYPKGITTGNQTFKHNHDKKKRPRDQRKTRDQWDMARRKDRKTGFSTVEYKLVSSMNISINGAYFHFVSVEVFCDKQVTPYCDTPS